MLRCFKNVMVFAFVRNGRSNIILQETCSVLTYDNSRIGLGKLISLLFLSIRNCFMLIAFCVD